MKRRAFTAIEALLAAGIVALTAGMAIPMYRTYQARSDLDRAVEQVIQGLRAAQMRSQAGQNDAQWGFNALPPGVLFEGESYTLRRPEEDQPFLIPETITVSGLTEVIYSAIDGIPDDTGDIILEAPNGDSRTVTVESGGVLTSTGIQTPDDGFLPSDNEWDGDDDESEIEEGDDISGDSDDPDGTGGTDDADCQDRFVVRSDGSVETTGTVDVTFKALGSAITLGSNGPAIKVRVSASTDAGKSWIDLFGGKDIVGGEMQTIENLPSGTSIAIKSVGRYAWLFNKTYKSNDQTGHVQVLRNGDPAPAYAPYGTQQSVEAFLRPILGVNGKISIGQYDAVALFELGTLSGDGADFQDAVILMQFSQKSGSCSETDDAKFKIQFNRVENEGTGNANRSVYVGPQAIHFAENQWIPLKIAGQSAADLGLVEDVPGLSVQRADGYVRVLSYGSHSFLGKEIVDARITFDKATVTSIQNDTGQNATENPFDAVVNDGSSGDEATVAPNSESVLFQTRVTSADDAIIIFWQQSSETSNSSASASSSSAASSTSSVSSDASSQSSEQASSDPCAASYAIEDGEIVLNEPADVSFHVLGTAITYGVRGPQVPVYFSVSLDGGNSWRSLFKLRSIAGGKYDTLSDIPAGSRILVRAEGRYGWLFQQIAHSHDGSGRVKLLRPGDDVPDTQPFLTISKLKRFMRDHISADRKISLGKREVLSLFELQDLGLTSDFQDAAVSIILEKPASLNICESSVPDDPNASSISSLSSSTSSESSSIGSEGEQIVVCHYPPGNRKNVHTLTIDASAWTAHKGHGDRLGACEEDKDGDGVSNDNDLCPNTALPEIVPTEAMLFSRFALTEGSSIFREGPRKKVSQYTLMETKGCSCEQLIDVAEGTKTYYVDQFPQLLRNMRSLFPFFTVGARKYGCSDAVLRMIVDTKI
ncbi:MAG: thrombospondin type 3 repeat-containing protein [Candidatus Peribacteraceae bacterium]|nr:thrombospondin type 3 repeat-containing protein [Candidatus Peribacteraceae bacterium]